MPEQTLAQAAEPGRRTKKGCGDCAAGGTAGAVRDSTGSGTPEHAPGHSPVPTADVHGQVPARIPARGKASLEEEIRPMFRGIVHGVAFVATVISTIVFTVTSVWKRFNGGILLYLLSQLLQYGVSSVYHIPNWSPRIKQLLRHIDHICIFVLISGTQTSVIVNSIGLQNRIALFCIKLSWTISAIGIAKILIMNKLHNVFDLVIYCMHGSIIAPFYRILRSVDVLDRVLIYTGGLLYLLGGLVYGLEKPNPSPRIFGWHEVFHVFTIAANMCFAVIISRKYILSIFGTV